MISLRTGKGKSSDNAAEDHIVEVHEMVRTRKQEPAEQDTRRASAVHAKLRRVFLF